MFTGIITAQGTVRQVTPIGGGQDMRMVIATPAGWLEGAAIGASIACSGCCLTAISYQGDAFTVEASAETLSKTTLGGWGEGKKINLERALKLGDELGGHVVSGHVDGLGKLEGVRQENGSLRLTFSVGKELARFIAAKGSVTIDGVSLTVNETEGETFGVNIIPHTAEVTTLGALKPGDAVHIEIDMLARYVARLREYGA
ncbi:riboflavin synthase [Acetobacteraceae bacterium H6797]|nr:riboflavin synthase [Acetobacteraceae bacterium H6797]